MRIFQLEGRNDAFAVLGSTQRSQAALMILAPGEATGFPHDSDHPQAEQWLFVIDGEGEVAGDAQRIPLRPQTLVIIEAGEGHQVLNRGSVPLRTLSVYAPPAY
jgi:mannose-6-phosphate isomerase-like protein (cupin superfamily)